MTHRPLHTTAAFAIAFTFGTALLSADQVRRRTDSPQQNVDTALKIGTTAFAAKGTGSCTHAPKASIYGVISEMRSVRQSAEGRSVQLTFWKPADGSATMFSLSLNTSTSTTISTVRGGDVAGSGSVSFAPSGTGGTFTVNAKTKAGEAVTGTIACDAFAPARAEGGN